MRENSSQQRPGTLSELEWDRGFRDYSALLDLYKHHLDLFFKGLLTYLAIVAGLSGFVFGSEVRGSARDFLLALIAAMSGLNATACFVGAHWVATVSRRLEAVSQRLGLECTAFPAARALALLAGIGSLLFIGVSLVLLVAGGSQKLPPN